MSEKKWKLRKKYFLKTRDNRPIFIFTITVAVIYFVLLFLFPKGNPILFWLLIAGEVFHLWQLATYIYTTWNMEHRVKFSKDFQPAVDIFITVAGEPVDIVAETSPAAKSIN